jgi:hypothetical protein
VTQFWVCEQVLDWLKEDGKLGAKELKRKLKESHKIDVTYRKVYLGKQLAMDKLYEPWAESFDNLHRFKAQIEDSSPVLTVKIRQPSHEFTFGVGMSFIPYPLVLTPVV